MKTYQYRILSKTDVLGYGTIEAAGADDATTKVLDKHVKDGRLITTTTANGDTRRIDCNGVNVDIDVSLYSDDDTVKTDDDGLFWCPKCKGPHFNITKSGHLICCNVTELTDFKLMPGGCGWSRPIEPSQEKRTMEDNTSPDQFFHNTSIRTNC